MYRQYENPYTLEERLAAARAAAAEDPEDYDLACEVYDLEQRVNFAWQDDEEG